MRHKLISHSLVGHSTDSHTKVCIKTVRTKKFDQGSTFPRNKDTRSSKTTRAMKPLPSKVAITRSKPCNSDRITLSNKVTPIWVKTCHQSRQDNNRCTTLSFLTLFARLQHTSKAWQRWVQGIVTWKVIIFKTLGVEEPQVHNMATRAKLMPKSLLVYPLLPRCARRIRAACRIWSHRKLMC